MEKVTKNVQSKKKRKVTRRFVSRQFGDVFFQTEHFVVTASISEIFRGFEGLLNIDFQCLKFLLRRLRGSCMRKLCAPVRFLQKLGMYVFFHFYTFSQCGIFTRFAFDTAKTWAGASCQYFSDFPKISKTHENQETIERFLLAPKCYENTRDMMQCPKRPPLVNGAL